MLICYTALSDLIEPRIESAGIPINDDVKAVLQDTTHRLDVAYVFFNPTTGKQYKDVKHSFHTACKKAGITFFCLFDIRHTFASHLVMVGVDITTVSRLSGHKSLIMTLKYSHLALDHLQNAINRLNITGEEKRTAYLLHSAVGN